ncbi:MAG: ankyrin repeat domain-containing protein [Candidatus Babeliales bacterium]
MQKSIIRIVGVLVVLLSLPKAQAMFALDDALYQAAAQGDVAKVNERIQAHVNINEVGVNNGDTALHLAVRNGHLAVVNALLDVNVDVAKENHKRETPLSIARDAYIKAVEAGDLDKQQIYLDILNAFLGNNTDTDRDLLRHIVLENIPGIKRALNQGANANSRGRGLHGMMPVHYVIAHYPVDRVLPMVKLLLEKNADKNQQDDDGMTPLAHATVRRLQEVVEYLLAQKVNVDQADKTGQTPLHHYAARGDLEGVNALLSAHANPNAVDQSNQTPLFFAAMRGYDAVVAALLAAQADPNAQASAYAYTQDKKGLTVVQVAQNSNIVRMLVEKGANPHQFMNPTTHETLLHYAVKTGDAQLVRLLLEKNVDVNAPDHVLRTPLHFIVQYANVATKPIVSLLLAKGANPTLENLTGETPIDFARRGQLALAGRILSRGELEHEDYDALIDELTHASAPFVQTVKTTKPLPEKPVKPLSTKPLPTKPTQLPASTCPIKPASPPELQDVLEDLVRALEKLEDQIRA